MSNDFTDYFDSKNLRSYFNQISKFPVLSQDEEKRLAVLIRKGDKNALKRLIEANLKFVVSYVKKYRGMGLSLFDLINEGNLGLIEAAKRFDSRKNVKFISYAVWWIRQAILQALAEQSRIVRLPLNRVGVLHKISKVSNALEQRLGHEPSPNQIADHLEMTEEEIRNTMQISPTHLSLDQPISSASDDNTLMDVLEDETAPSTDQIMIQDALRLEIEKAFGSLTKREAEVLSWYFGLTGAKALTLEEIGVRLGLTRERVRQIKEKALKRLRHATRSKSLRAFIDS